MSRLYRIATRLTAAASCAMPALDNADRATSNPSGLFADWNPAVKC